jgi:hypothetical protein
MTADAKARILHSFLQLVGHLRMTALISDQQLNLPPMGEESHEMKLFSDIQVDSRI